MTGFGRAQESFENMTVTVELKSVNHRYLEISSRFYRGFSFLEDKLKSYIQSRVSRGKVECFVQIEIAEGNYSEVKVNYSLADAYFALMGELSERYNIENDLTVTSLARCPEVFEIRKTETDEEEVWLAVKTVLETAADNFVKMRAGEGTALRSNILEMADNIIRNVEYIEERSPETVKEYNEKLLTRMREFLDTASVDEQRVLTEAAIFADKVAVAEETVRLRSHIKQLREMLDSDAAVGSNVAVGRKLDFLVQEINREANTIGSKAQDVEIAKRVIEMKSDIEKIREQIQNIE